MDEEETLKKLKARAARFCAFRERATSEVEKKLVDWGASANQSSQVLELLKAEKFVDDLRFCKAFTHDKFRIRRWGKIKIRYHLQHLNMSDENIEYGIASIDEEEYVALARHLLQQKLKTMDAALPEIQKQQKLRNYMMQKGYESDLIRRLSKVS